MQKHKRTKLKFNFHICSHSLTCPAVSMISIGAGSPSTWKLSFL